MYSAMSSADKREMYKHTDVVFEKFKIDGQEERVGWCPMLQSFVTRDGNKPHTYMMATFEVYQAATSAVFDRVQRCSNKHLVGMDFLYYTAFQELVAKFHEVAKKKNSKFISVITKDPILLEILTEQGFRISAKPSDKYIPVCTKRLRSDNDETQTQTGG